MKKKHLGFFLCVLFIMSMLLQGTLFASALQTVVQLPDGSGLDYVYYSVNNPDVVSSVGDDPRALANHYWTQGIQEGRLPYEGAKPVGSATVLSLVNDYRTQNGLPALATDPVLVQAAQSRARELADNQLFSHTRPDGSKWANILGSARSNYATLGENLARKQTSATNVLAAWQQSTEHNGLLLNAKFGKAGVGVAKSASGDFYFVLIAG